MSWQCPICETVNQDVTPVCTVCGNLAPVIDTYISLEAIERIQIYNEKLDEIHIAEIDKDYQKMLATALEAISLYKENALALEKAKQALMNLQQQSLKEKVLSLLDKASDIKDLNGAYSIVKLATSLGIVDGVLERMQAEVKLKMARKKEVDQLLEDSFHFLMKLNMNQALEVVEEGMIKHSNSKRLKSRREEIKTFITQLNEATDKKIQKRRSFPPTSKTGTAMKGNKTDDINKENPPEDFPKRKFPKVKRT